MLQDEHDEIAFADTFGRKVVASLVAHPLDVSEGECVLLAVFVLPDQRPPLGVVDGDVIHDVVSEVEIIRTYNLQALQQTLFIEFFSDVSKIDVPHDSTLTTDVGWYIHPLYIITIERQ